MRKNFWKIGTLLAVCLLCIIFFLSKDEAGNTARLSADSNYYYVYAPSLILDGDLDLSNQYEVTGDKYNLGQQQSTPPVNVFGIGPSLASLPFFIFGIALDKLSGRDIDGFSESTISITLFASLLATLMALFFCVRILKKVIGCPTSSFAVTLIMFLSSWAIFYAIRQPGYAHPFAMMATAWLMDHWLVEPKKTGEARTQAYWMVAGITVGLSALMRPQCVLWGVLFVFTAIDEWNRIGKKERLALIRKLLVATLFSLLVFSPQLIVWKILFGSFVVTPQGDGFLWWSSPALLETMFSPRNGLLPWHPIFLFSFLGVLLSLPTRPRLCMALWIGFCGQWVVNAAAWDWWAGASFGARRFDSCFAFLTLGLGLLLDRLYDVRILWLKKVLLSMGGLAVILLALANTRLSFSLSIRSIRMHAGAPVWQVFDRADAWFSDVFAARVSHLSNAPARWLTAYNLDTDMERYDEISGVHVLEELFPGLNHRTPKLEQTMKLHTKNKMFLRGMTPGPSSKSILLENGVGTMIAGFNRRGHVNVVFLTATANINSNQFYLNDERCNVKGHAVSCVLKNYKRGTNVLKMNFPKQTVITKIVFSSQLNTLGKLRN